MKAAAQQRKKIAKLGELATKKDLVEERIANQKSLFQVDSSERHNPLK